MFDSCFVSTFQSMKSYTIEGLHHAPLTCLEWSMNGMKLFTGDDDGVVVCTDVDYSVVCVLNIFHHMHRYTVNFVHS